MADRDDVIERLKKVSRYFKSMLKVGYDGDSDVYTEHRESVKMAIELLKEEGRLIETQARMINDLGFRLLEKR